MDFHVDPIKLIKYVERRPCIWNRNDPNNKDKIFKEKAWREIYLYFVPNYDSLSTLQQHTVGEAIHGKWRNIRDAFFRAIKRYASEEKDGCKVSQKKKYIYHNSLRFLTLGKDCTVSNGKLRRIKEEHNDYYDDDDGDEGKERDDEQGEREEDSTDGFGLSLFEGQPSEESNQDIAGSQNNLWFTTPDCIINESEPNHSAKRLRLHSNIIENEETKIFINKTVPDEDEAFFMSVLPTVRRFSEDEKLEFRISVLGLIKTIKQNALQRQN